MNKYDYIVVGSGLFGSVFAYEASKRNKKVLVIDKKDHIGGNIYTRQVEGINEHVYGAHIFHTSNKDIYDYLCQFTQFNNYINSPIACYKGEIYNLPFNMNTFNKMWGVITPQQAKDKIASQIKEANIKEPKNLEEQAISLVGVDIYQKLIKEYTQKQWHQDCKDLPSFIIKRLPVRFTYDNNYFNDPYQGIPIGGYTPIIEKMLANCEVRLNYDFFEHKEELINLSDKIIFTGMIDQYYDYCYGKLGYRSLRFETELLDIDNYQGNAVVNYTSHDQEYTRIIEHKHFEFGKQDKTIITKEYPQDYQEGLIPYYPINNQENNDLYQKYIDLASKESNVIFGGRLGMYSYFDMDKVIQKALELVDNEFNKA